MFVGLPSGAIQDPRAHYFGGTRILDPPRAIPGVVTDVRIRAQGAEPCSGSLLASGRVALAENSWSLLATVAWPTATRWRLEYHVFRMGVLGPELPATRIDATPPAPN